MTQRGKFYYLSPFYDQGTEVQRAKGFFGKLSQSMAGRVAGWLGEFPGSNPFMTSEDHTTAFWPPGD